METRKPHISVVIPSYRVCGQVLDVVARIGPEVHRIYVVNSACPDRSGDLVEARYTLVRYWAHFCSSMGGTSASRIFCNYFPRDMTAASLELVFGLTLLVSGVVFGGYHWICGLSEHAVTPTGTVMLAALTALAGLQLSLAFVGDDVANQPRRPIHPDLPDQGLFSATASIPLPLSHRADLVGGANFVQAGNA